MLRLVPRTNIIAGIIANPMAKEDQMILFARDPGKTHHPAPAAKTVSMAA